MNMKNEGDTHLKGYAIAVVLGALGGGLVVLLVTRAIPRLLSQMMAGMMEQMRGTMMAQMEQDGLTPEEMCRQMMAGFNQEKTKESGS